MYKRILTAVAAAIVAVWLLFVVGPMGVAAARGPESHIVAHAR